MVLSRVSHHLQKKARAPDVVILVRILFNHPVSVNLRKIEGKGGGHALISMFLSLPAMDEDNDEINRFGSWVLF